MCAHCGDADDDGGGDDGTPLFYDFRWHHQAPCQSLPVCTYAKCSKLVSMMKSGSARKIHSFFSKGIYACEYDWGKCNLNSVRLIIMAAETVCIMANRYLLDRPVTDARLSPVCPFVHYQNVTYIFRSHSSTDYIAGDNIRYAISSTHSALSVPHFSVSGYPVKHVWR